MKCPKCGYTSFDHLDECKRCGTDLRDVRTLLGLIVVRPEDRIAVPQEAAFEEPVPSEAFVTADEEIHAVDLGGGEDGPEEFLSDMDFEESFEDVVERTSYEAVEEANTGTPVADVPEEDDGLLDLDFSDIFAEEKKEKE
ncbi:hypothetical protein [Deferrisoma palaeochoriense]